MAPMTTHTILIIEDNPFNMELATDVLEHVGFAVRQAATGEAGITEALRLPPDLILMDVALPGMDGLTATHQLKQNPQTRTIPIVFLTSHAMCGDKDQALAAGGVLYLTKPLNTRTLADTLRAVLAGQEKKL